MNIFFRLAAAGSALFIVTVLSLVTILFSDPRAPLARFLNAHGGQLITWEVALTLLCGLLALVVDRVEILRAASRTPQPVDKDATPSS